MGRAGWRVAVGARRLDRLEEVAKQVEAAGGRAMAQVLDVSEAGSVDTFCAAVEAHFGALDVLVNNAGQNLASLIHDATENDLRSDVEVNLMGAIWMTRRVLPGMLERRVGDVVFLGSDRALRPRPYQGAYGAAKAGLEVFARVLEMETEGSGVRSMVVRAGPTGSEFGNRMPQDKLPEILESWKYWGVLRQLHWMPAQSVAKAIVRALSVPVEESYTPLLEVQPGGRRKGVGE